jgi:hypothetical protein
MKNFCVIISGSAEIGPYVIPQRGQSYISAKYCLDNNLHIKSVITDGIYGEKLNKLIYLLKKENVQVVFTSFYQLIETNKISFIKNVGIKKIHFALENIKSHNKRDLEKIYKEVFFFNKLKYIKSKNFKNYKQLYNKFGII